MPTAAQVLRRPVLRSLLHPFEVNRALLIPQAPNIPLFSLNSLNYPKRAWIRQPGEKGQWEGARVLLGPPPDIKFSTLPHYFSRFSRRMGSYLSIDAADGLCWGFWAMRRAVGDCLVESHESDWKGRRSASWDWDDRFIV